MKDETPSHRRARRYFANGIEFATLKALADAAGVKYLTAVKRMHRGWTDEEIYTGVRLVPRKKYRPADVKRDPKPRRRRIGTPVTLLGTSYPNVIAAYDALKPSVSLVTVKRRLFMKWPQDEAFGLVPHEDGRRARKGTKIDRRVPRERRSFVINGQTYEGYAALARAFGLPEWLVYQRIRDHGWSPERAVTESVSDTVVIDGVRYRSATKAWEAIGKTSFGNFTVRRSSQLPLKICLGLEPLPVKMRYVVEGKEYSTISDVASAYGLTDGQLQHRLAYMTIDEAVHWVPANGRYSSGVFAKDPELADATGILYFVRINTGSGYLHKVGITLRGLSLRFKDYDYQPIAEFSGPLLLLHEIEQRALESFRHLQYRADEDFDGKTETFLLTDAEELLFLEHLRSMMSEASGAVGDSTGATGVSDARR